MVEFVELAGCTPMAPQDSITQLMTAFRQGNQEAAAGLANLLYPELRRMAAARMKKERTEHTLQPTALVHELYLELLKVRAFGNSGLSAEEERTAFLKLAGHMMKRMLVHHARPLYRKAQRVQIEDLDLTADRCEQCLQDVEDALSRLAKIEPRLRAVVEMKVFEGMTNDEAARRLGCSRATIASCWSFAQRWLRDEWAGNGRQ